MKILSKIVILSVLTSGVLAAQHEATRDPRAGSVSRSEALLMAERDEWEDKAALGGAFSGEFEPMRAPLTEAEMENIAKYLTGLSTQIAKLDAAIDAGADAATLEALADSRTGLCDDRDTITAERDGTVPKARRLYEVSGREAADGRGAEEARRAAYFASIAAPSPRTAVAAISPSDARAALKSSLIGKLATLQVQLDERARTGRRSASPSSRRAPAPDAVAGSSSLLSPKALDKAGSDKSVGGTTVTAGSVGSAGSPAASGGAGGKPAADALNLKHL